MPTLPIFIINMPSATDRRAAMARQLDALNLNTHWIDAIRGKDLRRDDLVQIYSDKANRNYFRRPLSPGEIGCYASHRAVWQKMLDDGIETAIIMEDDVRVTSLFTRALKVLEQSMPADMVKLLDDRDGTGNKQVPAKDSDFHWVSYKRVPNGTGSYAISLSGARKLLARPRIFRPIDVDLQFYREHKLTIAGLRPYPVEATFDFESLIDSQGEKGSRKTFTWPWRNWRYRFALFAHRTFYSSANLQDVPNE